MLVCTCVLFVVSYLWLDIPIARFIHTQASPSLTYAGGILEEVGKSHWILGYSFLAVVLVWKTRRSAAYRHVALFASVAVAGLGAVLIKMLLNRARPPLLFTDGLYGFRPLQFDFAFLWQSFPSGHATTGLAIAVAGSIAWPRLRWLMWPIGLSIALGRVLYNVHYFSDVMAGAALGIVSAWLIQLWLTSHFQPWADSRWALPVVRTPESE